MIRPHFWHGEDASLHHILARREARAAQQRALLAQGSTLVSFTMNIPGTRKQFPLARKGFDEGLSLLEERFAGHILRQERCSAVTGEEALLLLDLDAETVKRTVTELEEHHPIGRLWDMDVLSAERGSLSRTELGLPRRRCFLCGGDAKECGRSRHHSHEELFFSAAELLHDHMRRQAERRVGICALQAALGEVSVTPKPGLVDRHDSGSHKDMDFFTFVDSASALSPWFCAFFRAGWVEEGDLFSTLRSLGRQAEREMFAATGGVNTHKGLIFSMAIFCGAIGAAAAAAFPAAPSRDAVVEEIRALGKASLGDFCTAYAPTAGLRYYRAHGVTGIRGEAAAGYPSVFEIGLPALRQWLAKGLSLNDAAAAALLALMAAVEDTNMIHRGGIAEARRRREEAARVLQELSEENLQSVLREMNEDYIRASLSPGGCADLLALTLFCYFLEL